MTIRSNFTKTLVVSPVALALVGTSSPAGHEIAAAGKEKMVAPLETRMPPAMLTLGGKFSEGLTSGYMDSVLPFWAPGDSVFFLNTRTTIDDNQQRVSSYGLGWRYMVPDRDIIVGANAYYDAIHSMHGHDYDQLGLGAEVLTRWVDARFNYYRPEHTEHEVGRTSRESVDRRTSSVFLTRAAPNRFLIQQQVRTNKNRKTTIFNEAAIEGWNAEIGFLMPGLDRYMELRLFAGAYGYDNQFDDYVGFKARAEARLLPGVIANVEYWDDAYLTGGNWTGEVRVSVPFSIFNLASGRNPFEGAAEMFKPRKREFRERLSDMVMRSHRVDTNTGGNTSQSSSSNTTTLTLGAIDIKPPVKVLPPAGGPPQIGIDGGEGDF